MDGILLSSVLITHNIINRIDFSYLAEFFRFLGVYVCEDIQLDTNEKTSDSDEKTEVELRTVYNAYIYIGNYNMEQKRTRENVIGESNLSKKIVYAYDFCTQNQMKEADSCHNDLTECDDEISFFSAKLEKEGSKYLISLVSEVFNDKASELLTPLIKAFAEFGIWFHSMNLQYYAKKKSFVATAAKDAFLNCYTRIKEHLDNANYGCVQYIYEYALIWCALKVNTTCDYNQEILYFPIENLVKRCKELYRKYQGFSNAKVLEGLCYEPSSNSANEALQAFGSALKEIGDTSFASPVYYWIGKRYESYHDYREEAEKCYKMANEKKSKFRNYFKLAVFKRNAQQYDEAIELFEKIIQKLNKKREWDFMDPLELEYLFKTYTQICYIFHLEKKYIRVIETGKEAVKVYSKEGGLIESCKYFKAFYGDDAEKYREELKKRLDLKMVYSLMADGYAQIQDQENAEDCLKKIKEGTNG